MLFNSKQYKISRLSYQTALVIRYLEHINQYDKLKNKLFNDIKNTCSDEAYARMIFNDAEKLKTRLPPARTDSLKFTDTLLKDIHMSDNIEIECFLFCFASLYMYSHSNKKYDIKLGQVYSLMGKRVKRSSKEMSYIYNNPYVEIKPYKYEEYVVPRENFLLELEESMSGKNCSLEISNFLNLHWYYLNYFNIGRFGICENCGCIYKYIKNNQKYCNICNRIVDNENRMSKFIKKTQRYDHEKVIKLYKSGKTQKEISEILHIPFTSVRLIIYRKYK